MLNKAVTVVVAALWALLIGVAIFAPLLSPQDPTQGVLVERLMPPVWAEGGSADHLLGTDRLGRDVLSRLIYGARISLTVCALAILFSGMVGSTLGIIAGYYGGWTDTVLMRLVDLALSFPIILLALLFGVLYGPGFANVILVISLVLWSQYARMARAETLRLKDREFVDLARSAGCSTVTIMTRHLVPNIAGSLIVLATLQVGTVIILESSLSFLGVGVPPPTPAWGSMVAEGRSYLFSAAWLAMVPGVAIVLTVMSVNVLGDSLAEHLNPKLRGGVKN
ncbi:ABC transporter permease [Gilvimarinus sp. F26214L]|uniref:ABC transporter permease n=1 Tax=Gilvimarinus sp. DZF01 TaxID=3461371 RepID=UPI004045DBC5